MSSFCVDFSRTKREKNLDVFWKNLLLKTFCVMRGKAKNLKLNKNPTSKSPPKKEVGRKKMELFFLFNKLILQSRKKRPREISQPVKKKF